MILPNVQAQEMIRWKVLAAFGTAMSVVLRIMNFKLFEGGKCEGITMRWK